MKVLLPSDSPFRNPPAALDPVQKAAWDAVRFALDMTHVSYLRLLDSLVGIGEATRRGEILPELPTLALADAWGVVDNLWRLRCVLRNFPGLKKAPELEVHLRAIDAVEDLRHGIQHVSERLRAEALRDKPILGSVSWLWTPDEPLTGGFMMTVAAGAMREGWVPLTNPGGRKFHRPIGMVTLGAFGKELDLTALVVRVVQIAKGLDQGARIAVGDSAKGGADMVLMVAFQFRNTSSESTAV